MVFAVALPLVAFLFLLGVVLIIIGLETDMDPAGSKAIAGYCLIGISAVGLVLALASRGRKILPAVNGTVLVPIWL